MSIIFNENGLIKTEHSNTLKVGTRVFIENNGKIEVFIVQPIAQSSATIPGTGDLSKEFLNSTTGQLYRRMVANGTYNSVGSEQRFTLAKDHNYTGAPSQATADANEILSVSGQGGGSYYNAETNSFVTYNQEKGKWIQVDGTQTGDVYLNVNNLPKEDQQSLTSTLAELKRVSTSWFGEEQRDTANRNTFAYFNTKWYPEFKKTQGELEQRIGSAVYNTLSQQPNQILEQRYGNLSLQERIDERNRLRDGINLGGGSGDMSDSTYNEIALLAALDRNISEEINGSGLLPKGTTVEFNLETEMIDGSDLKPHTGVTLNGERFTVNEYNASFGFTDKTNMFTLLDTPVTETTNEFLFPYANKNPEDVALNFQEAIQNWNTKNPYLDQIDPDNLTPWDLDNALKFLDDSTYDVADIVDIGEGQGDIVEGQGQGEVTDKDQDNEPENNNQGSDLLNTGIETKLLIDPSKTNPETEGNNPGTTWNDYLENNNARATDIERAYGSMNEASKLKILNNPITSLELEEGF